MAKDSYWFRHDSNAGRATRMRKMAFIYGHWGKGIYWDVIEILRDQDGYYFEKDETSLQMLCDLIGCKDVDKFFNWFNDCIRLDLLQSDEKYFYSDVLIENMESWEAKKTNGSKGGRGNKKLNESEIKANEKLNESIREEKSIEDNKREDKKELIFPFNSKEFLESWNELVKNKKWRKKSISALQASLNKLKGNSEPDAIKMLQNALAGEWQGLHDLKPHEKSNQGKITNKIDTILEANLFVKNQYQDEQSSNNQ